MRAIRAAVLSLAMLAACERGGGSAPLREEAPDAGEAQPEAAPAPRGVTRPGGAQRKLEAALDAWFDGHPAARAGIQVDKPLYQPGETLWFRASVVRAATLAAEGDTGMTFELVDPRGAVIARQRAESQDGMAGGSFALPDGLPGGEYRVRVRGDWGGVGERPVVVSSYETPRFKTKLELLKKAYGPGDLATATLEVKRATGEPFADREVTGVLTLDGAELPRVKVKTDGAGAALVAVKLPAAIARGDGMLTVLVEDAGVAESVSRRVPIVLSKMKLALFPEGGDLVAGLPARVYFAAEDLLGKPADVEGEVVDDHGQRAAAFASIHDGMGRFAFTPATGRTYRARIVRPAGIAEEYALPLAQESGCTLRTFDDFAGELAAIRVAVRCSEERKVVVVAALRGKRVADATAQAGPRTPAIVHLVPSAPLAQGVARVTVLSESLEPLAERLVFRGARSGLRISLTPDEASYGPRDRVTLAVETRDASGEPVPADVGLAVVDDTVLSLADDKQGNLLSQLLLEPELPGKVEEAGYYFHDAEPKTLAALDALLGTRGWRRFEWKPVFAPPPPAEGMGAMGTGRGAGLGGYGFAAKRALRPFAMASPAPAEKRELAQVGVMHQLGRGDLAPRPQAPLAVGAMGMLQEQLDGPVGNLFGPVGGEAHGLGGLGLRGRGEGGGGGLAAVFGGDADDLAAAPGAAWEKVRTFVVPDYQPGYDGPRTDFRETVYWNPSVRTGPDGRARVSFVLSDAVTSFRAVAEGLSTRAGAAVGHGEAVLASKLPFFMDVKLPLEVSAGDRIDLPLTLRSERPEQAVVALQASFGEGVKLGGAQVPPQLALAPGAGRTLVFPLTVEQGRRDVEVAFSAKARGLGDEVKKTLRVVPLGFPRSASRSGTLARAAEESVDLSGALPGSVRATVTLFPSPVAAMLTGVEGILREPAGCFEQASSANYPNVMAMQYLEERGVADPALVARVRGLLDHGYRKLTGYESAGHGYEWFGGSPAHEALTAYGVMEFTDMARVFGGVDPAMLARTEAWLRGRRDGKGGFERNPRALDSFGAAPREVTDAYIVFALAEAGVKDLAPELAATVADARRTRDPYVLALAARASLDVKPAGEEGRALAAELAALQQADGRFHGATTSITRSGGLSLDVETSSLATLALLSAGREAEARRAVEWLASSRQGGGVFGSTQATVLALKALAAWDRASRRTPAGGAVTLLVNGEEVATQRFEKGRRDAVVFDGLGARLAAGKNTFALRLDSASPLPYTIAVDYASNDPATSPRAPLAVSTAIARGGVKMGETVRVTARVDNRKDEGLPMALVRVGIPGGLTFQTWQLKELVDRHEIDFYETRPREVILYYRALPPRAHREIPLDLVAAVPGSYTAPASSAYLYYTAEEKAWAPPLHVDVRG